MVESQKRSAQQTALLNKNLEALSNNSQQTSNILQSSNTTNNNVSLSNHTNATVLDVRKNALQMSY